MPLDPIPCGYDMDTRHGVSSPVTHRCLHTPLSHTVLVTVWTHVLVSAWPFVRYRTVYDMDTRLGVDDDDDDLMLILGTSCDQCRSTVQ